MPWKKVEGGGRSTAEPKISMRKSGSIGINTAALGEYFDGVEYVELFYNEADQKVGIKPVEEETDDSFTLSKSESGGSVTPMSFLRGNKLIPEITTQYRPTMEKVNSDTEIVAIDLDDPLTTYGGPDSDDE